METVLITGSSRAMMSTPSGTSSNARSDTSVTPSPPAAMASAVGCSATVWTILGSKPFWWQAMRTAWPKWSLSRARIHG